jgi:hypothetical protein
MGWFNSSGSSSKSEQYGQSSVAQQYVGTCNVTCSNLASNIVIDLSNTTVDGGVNITQECTVDANCMFQVTQDATASVMFAASNSSNASDAGGVVGVGNSDKSESDGYQDIRESINNSISQTCNLTSSNDLENVKIYAANSDLSGGINIDQSANAAGSCSMNASMTAAAYSSGQMQNESASGKYAKGDKGESLVAIATILITIIILGGLGIMLYKHMSKPKRVTRIPRTQIGQRIGDGIGRAPTLVEKLNDITGLSELSKVMPSVTDLT